MMIAALTLLLGVALGYANGRKDADDINSGTDGPSVMQAIVERGLIGALAVCCIWPFAGLLSLPVMMLVSGASYAVTHRVTVSAYTEGGLPGLRLDLYHPYDAAWIAAFGARAALAATAAEVLVALLGAWWLA